MPKPSPKLEEVFDRLSMMRQGKFDLSWMQANPAGWGTRATPSVGGLTLTDINVGPYGRIPEYGSTHGSMAPRGAEIPPETPSREISKCYWLLLNTSLRAMKRRSSC